MILLFLLVLFFVNTVQSVGRIAMPVVSLKHDDDNDHESNGRKVRSECVGCAAAGFGTPQWCACCNNRCAETGRCNTYQVVCADQAQANLQLVELERREAMRLRDSGGGPSLHSSRAAILQRRAEEGRRAAIQAGSLIQAPSVDDDDAAQQQQRPSVAVQERARLQARLQQSQFSSQQRLVQPQQPQQARAEPHGGQFSQFDVAAARRPQMLLRQRLLETNEQARQAQLQRNQEALAARNRQIDAIINDRNSAADKQKAAEARQQLMEREAKMQLALEEQRDAGQVEVQAAAQKLLAMMDIGARDVVRIGWQQPSPQYLIQFYTPDCVLCPEHERVLLLVTRALARQANLEVVRIDCTALIALCRHIGVRVYPTLALVAENGQAHFLPRDSGNDPDAVIEFALGRYVQRQSLPWPWKDSKPADSANELETVDKLIAEAEALLAPPTTTTTTITTTTTTTAASTQKPVFTTTRRKIVVDPMLPQHERRLQEEEDWL
jgi:hypothetical protein